MSGFVDCVWCSFESLEQERPSVFGQEIDVQRARSGSCRTLLQKIRRRCIRTFGFQTLAGWELTARDIRIKPLAQLLERTVFFFWKNSTWLQHDNLKSFSLILKFE
jgi:hypothetical protein